MSTVIEISNVTYALYNNLILDNINLSVKEQEFLGIIGPNGGGKTTLLKMILGLLSPDRGSVKIFGKSPAKMSRVIGYVPQFTSFDISYPISVHDVVGMGTLSSKMFSPKQSLPENELIIEDVLKKVNIEHLKDRVAGKLSGGEKQRLLIARALAVQPKILLLDEPTASIDSKTGEDFYDLLIELNKEMTILLVSHDVGAIARSVKKIACLNKTLIYHDTKELTPEMIEKTYHCPVDLIAHGHPHRVFDEHEH